MIKKEEVISFVWQHILLLVSLYVMTFGVAACVRSQLGSSVISTIPYVMASAGKMLDYIPGWTIGGYTIMMNAIFVVLQILILRRNFEWVQLFQLAIGFIFGMFIDLNMVLTQWMVSENILVNALVQIAGCTILGFGIAMEVKCGSVTMPGEGISIAIHKVTGWPFPKAKIRVDITLVVLAVFVLFSASRFMEMGDRGHRNALRHGLCRCYSSPIQQASCVVRPPAPLSSRLPKICLRTCTIHKKTDVTSRLFKFNG